MCVGIPRANPAANMDAGRIAQAASDSAVNERRGAQGFSSSILGGLTVNPNSPSLARQILLGS